MQPLGSVRNPLTSDYELLPVDPGVALGLLQQADPVVHLLGGVGVAVDHPVGRDDHKRVRSGKENVTRFHFAVGPQLKYICK